MFLIQIIYCNKKALLMGLNFFNQNLIFLLNFDWKIVFNLNKIFIFVCCTLIKQNVSISWIGNLLKVIIFTLKSSKTFPRYFFFIKWNNILIIKLEPSFTIVISNQRVIMTSLWCTSMNYNTFQSILCFHLFNILMFHKLFKINFHWKRQLRMNFNFVPFHLIIYNSLHI